MNWWNLNKNKLKPLIKLWLIGGNYIYKKREFKRILLYFKFIYKNNNEISEMFTWNFVVIIIRGKLKNYMITFHTLE